MGIANGDELAACDASGFGATLVGAAPNSGFLEIGGSEDPSIAGVGAICINCCSDASSREVSKFCPAFHLGAVAPMADNSFSTAPGAVAPVAAACSWVLEPP